MYCKWLAPLIRNNAFLCQGSTPTPFKFFIEKIAAERQMKSKQEDQRGETIGGIG